MKKKIDDICVVNFIYIRKNRKRANNKNLVTSCLEETIRIGRIEK